jgi:hypothetical protein
MYTYKLTTNLFLARFDHGRIVFEFLKLVTKALQLMMAVRVDVGRMSLLVASEMVKNKSCFLLSLIFFHQTKPSLENIIKHARTDKKSLYVDSFIITEYFKLYFCFQQLK